MWPCESSAISLWFTSVQIAVLYSLQTRMIFPGGSTKDQPSAKVRPRPGTELVHLTTTQGERIVALFGPALLPDGRTDPLAVERPTMIYFYGNAMCLNDATFELEQFRRLGLNVLVPEYVGYGMSSGSPSEKGCRPPPLRRTTTWYRHARLARTDHRRRLVAGRCRRHRPGLATGSRRADRILLVHQRRRHGPALAAIGARIALAPSPIRQHSQDRRRFACPILIGHGRLDRIVPFGMGEELAAKAKGPRHHALDRPSRA